MYWQDKYVLKDSIEYEIKYAGRYGAKGEKRGKKKKATPEVIKRQNQKNKEKRMRRLLKLNFDKGDFWICLKYPRGTRKSVADFEKDIRNFLATMRRRYKAHNEEFKFVIRYEVGAKGGMHLHMVIPRIRGADTEVIVDEAWKHGYVDYRLIDGNYGALAAYIVKEPDEDVEKQLSLFPLEERRKFVKYSTSRNLIRPKPERKIYSRRTVKRMILNGIKASKGYYIEKDSVVIGVNPYTGMSYIHYTESKVRDG